ncbi:MAG TPA: hypothetical protein VMT03_03365 [Polyangia bacterium]|nr:hypothetical protein [Polyangia bacterium]
MRGKTLKVVLVICGLAGGVYAAEEVTTTQLPTVEQTIAQQLAAEGREAQEAGLTKQIESLSAEQMLGLSIKYDQEMRQAVEHAEDVKILAYRSHDIIRMSCIDDKIEQIKAVIMVTAPRYLMLRTFKSQLVVMQSQFAIISAAHARVGELAQTVDNCMGDNLDAVTAGRIQEEEVYKTDNNLNDPTRPQTSFEQIDRPPAASPYY